MRIVLAGKSKLKKTSVERAQERLRVVASRLDPTRVDPEVITLPRTLRAFYREVGNADLVCVEGVTSIVPDQPWGLEETTRGGDHRAMEAERLTRKDREDPREDAQEIFIGIENGVCEVSHDADPHLCRYADPAVISLRYGGHLYNAISESIMFPTRYVLEAKERIASGETTLTVGKVIAEHLGGDHANPYLVLTNGLIDRVDILDRAVFAALVQCQG